MQWPWVSRKYLERYRECRKDIQEFSRIMGHLHSILKRAEQEDVGLTSPATVAWKVSLFTDYHTVRTVELNKYVEKLKDRLDQELKDRRVRELAREVAREECGEDEE